MAHVDLDVALPIEQTAKWGHHQSECIAEGSLHRLDFPDEAGRDILA